MNTPLVSLRNVAAIACGLLLSACATAPETVPASGARVTLRPGLEAAEHRRDAEAVQLLSAFLAQSDIRRAEAEQAIGTLVTIDLARGAYEHASRAWEKLDPLLRNAFSEETQQTAAVAIALRAERPPTVEKHTGAVATLRDAAKLVRAQARFGSADVEAVIDTGANLSVATETLARRAGLRILPATVSAGAATGATVEAHPAIGDITLGGTVFRNAAILVVADAALQVSPTYRLEAIIGFPQLAAAGRVRFSPGEIVLDAPAATGHTAPIEMRGLDIYVDADVEGSPVRLHLDTGARSTTLGPRAAKALAARLKDVAFEDVNVGGAGGAVTRKQATLPGLPIRLGDAAAKVDAQYASDAAQLSIATDSDGRLGQDFYGQFASYTIDFDAMTIGFAPKR
jgi:predicted aspartyl protease